MNQEDFQKIVLSQLSYIAKCQEEIISDINQLSRIVRESFQPSNNEVDHNSEEIVKRLDELKENIEKISSLETEESPLKKKKKIKDK